MPKEIRNPRSEEAAVIREAALESDFWFWDDGNAALILREEPADKCQDLMERTARFGEAIIRFLKKVPRGGNHPENNRLVDQLVGAATSIGANYCEADDSVSGKDFRKSIGTCRKEAKESMFFLRMIAASEPSLSDEARALWREGKELNLIFGSIWRKGQ